MSAASPAAARAPTNFGSCASDHFLNPLVRLFIEMPMIGFLFRNQECNMWGPFSILLNIFCEIAGKTAADRGRRQEGRSRVSIACWRRAQGLAGEPGATLAAALRLSSRRASGVRQGPRRRKTHRLRLRGPGLLAARHQSRDFARNSRPSALASVACNKPRGRAMAHAIRFEKPGGPDVLLWQQVEVGRPGQGQVRLRQTAVGLNYVDT
jgi:hypothetical protein